MYHYDNTPASVWRTIEYADTFTGHTPLKRALVDAQLVDPGTGSTFKALETRGFIEVHGDWTSAVYIRLTTKGRKLVRDAMGVQTPKKLPTGTLLISVHNLRRPSRHLDFQDVNILTTRSGFKSYHSEWWDWYHSTVDELFQIQPFLGFIYTEQEAFLSKRRGS